MIAAVESGEMKKDVAECFNIPDSTLTTYSCSDVTSNFEKKRAKSEYRQFEECLMVCLIQSKQNKIPVERPILKEKAKTFENSLGITNFQASEDWLEKFKKLARFDLQKCMQKDYQCSWSINYELKDIFNDNETDRTLPLRMTTATGVIKTIRRGLR